MPHHPTHMWFLAPFIFLLDLTHAQLPSATVWEFQFTDVRSRVNTDGIQLAEVFLQDAAGANLSVVSAANPGGDQFLNDAQTADRVSDGILTNRWLDASIVGANGVCCNVSTLQLTLASVVSITDVVDAGQQWTVVGTNGALSSPFIWVEFDAGKQNMLPLPLTPPRTAKSIFKAEMWESALSRNLVLHPKACGLN